MACVVSNILETKCDIPTVPVVPLFPKPLDCDEYIFTSLQLESNICTNKQRDYLINIIKFKLTISQYQPQ